MLVGSLFSGIGGLELALESCGLGPVIWQAEIDPAARRVLATHWPLVHRYADVRQIDATTPRPEIICGGFPCQDISDAGTREGIKGSRSGLWSEFARIVRALRPEVVFIENVANLAIRGLDVVLRDLAACGFDAEWEVVRASEAGAPHRRARIFVLAYSSREGLARAAGRATSPGQRHAVRSGAVADTNRGRREGERAANHADDEGAPGREPHGRDHRFPPGPARIDEWDGPKPAVRRSDARIPVGLDRRWRSKNGIPARLRLLGNACCPQQAALAWRTLIARAAQLELGDVT